MFRKKIALAMAAVFLVSGCQSINPQTGKAETDTTKSTVLGGVIGGVIGGIVSGGDARAIAIGAAIGGGVGYVQSTKQREEELAQARKAAQEIRQATGYQPIVLARAYQDQTGAKAMGLQKVQLNIPNAEVVRSGALHPKAAGVLSKLESLSTQQRGELTVDVPVTAPRKVLEDIMAVAPNAKIVVSKRRDFQFKLDPRKLESTESYA